MLTTTVSVAVCPLVSDTVIVVPGPPFVVVTEVTVNVPGAVVNATVAIDVLRLVALKFPEYPVSLTVNVAVVWEQPDPTAAITTGFGLSENVPAGDAVGVGDGVGVAVCVGVGEAVGVEVGAAPEGVAVGVDVALALADTTGVGVGVAPVLGWRLTPPPEHAARAAHAAIADHVAVRVKICMNDPRNEACPHRATA